MIKWIIIILLAVNLFIAAVLLFGESVLFQQISKPAPEVHYEIKNIANPTGTRV